MITKENIKNLNHIREIISKPEAINQCNEWISKNLRKDIVVTGSPSTAEAVESLNNLPDSVAAIGPERAAVIHKKHILKKEVLIKK